MVCFTHRIGSFTLSNDGRTWSPGISSTPFVSRRCKKHHETKVVPPLCTPAQRIILRPLTFSTMLPSFRGFGSANRLVPGVHRNTPRQPPSRLGSETHNGRSQLRSLQPPPQVYEKQQCLQ